jgi:hypothetical protein
MKVYIAGNPLVKDDNVPLKLLPILLRVFPRVIFEEADPNENFIPEKGSIIIDTVEGIARPQLFDSIDNFVRTRSVSAHDYDLGFHLLLLRKLHKISDVRIIGVPKGTEAEECAPGVIALLRGTIKKII